MIHIGHNVAKLVFITLLLLAATVARGQTDDKTVLSQQVEDLKQAALNLNRDLLLLEEELLFPGNTQVAVFVSMDVGEFFELEAVNVRIDDKIVGSHLYTEKQISALYRGGVQRIYVGNIKSGQHEISAFFTGKGPAGRDYKRAAKLSFEKTSEPALLELKIIDSTQKLQPLFEIKEWELP
jgi:archaellum component FlaG (FlaF/FlaG flagellin family)